MASGLCHLSTSSGMAARYMSVDSGGKAESRARSPIIFFMAILSEQEATPVGNMEKRTLWLTCHVVAGNGGSPHVLLIVPCMQAV